MERLMPGHGRWMARAVSLIALLLLLHGTTGQAAVDVIKSPNDARQYQALTLPNGLRVLLVSDPTTELAAAAMNVNVGYYSDPTDRPGLAHFLEHMLFLGTEKYPDPSSFREFTASHGGRMNAYTGAENTVYFFDVDRRHIDEAIDRFAQFFVAPLFNETYVQHEMQAVESEYRLKIRDESRRLMEVLKETANPSHPFAKFSVGSVTTLRDREGDHARDAVIEFYRRHYSANLMTLAVVSAEPIERMRKLITGRMSAIPNRNLKPLEVSLPVLTPDRAGVRIQAVPLRDQYQLRLEFPFPWKESYRLSKPTLLIGHVLGHEGRGSLYDLLKTRGWVTGIEAGGSRLASNEGVVTVTMDLTNEGAAHVDDIAAATFGYISLVRREGIGRNVHAELARVNELDFLYRPKGPPISEATTLAENLQFYPARLAVFGPLYLADYDGRAVSDILSRLRPDNARLVVIAPDLPTEATSQYYHMAYGVQKLDASRLESWANAAADPKLALPEPNRFLPVYARLKTSTSPGDKPARLLDDPGLSVWHLQDKDFHVPKADVFVTLETPRAATTPRASAMTSLFITLVKDSLNAAAYPAETAGLDYHIYRALRGVGFSVSGYDEKEGLLADMVLDAILHFEIDPLDFETQRRELIRQWDNSRLNSPYLRVSGELDDLLYYNRWTPEQLSAAMADVSIADLRQFVSGLLSELNVELFVHGNVTSAEAVSLGHDIAGRIFSQAKPGPHVAREVTRLSPGKRYLRSLDAAHDDTAVLLYYQGPDDRIETAAGFLLLEQLIDGPFFDTLRTQEQIGYVVAAQSTSALRLPGINFLVQSPAKGANAVAARIDRFITEFRPRLADMTEDEFQTYKRGLLTMLREKDTSLERRSQRLQICLALEDYDFDRRDRLIDAVGTMTRQDLLKLYDDNLVSTHSRRLVVQSAGNGRSSEALAAKDGYEPITDMAAFKEEAPGFRLGAATELLPDETSATSP